MEHLQRIKRDIYLERLMNRRENGSIKVITGVRRSGKSFLLDPLFKEALIEDGVAVDHILKIEFDGIENLALLDGLRLFEYIREQIKDNAMYYVLLDEIQLVDKFPNVLNSLLRIPNVDLYVTGSNSRFLSSDVATELRGRGDEVHIQPLSFAEFMSVYDGDKLDAWKEYLTYGGLPRVLSCKTEEEKMGYLAQLFKTTYLKDIVDRNNVRRDDALVTVATVLASSVGSLTNVTKIANTFSSSGDKEISENTVKDYVKYLTDAFLIEKAERYDIRGRNYVGALQKYYYSDVGLRNALLNFRQQEPGHLMENVLYNELLLRGFNVDVGFVEVREENKRKQLEVDFVCNLGSKRYYVQSALNLDTREKTLQEEKSLRNIGDNFNKIIVVADSVKPWFTEEGVQIVGVVDFLLNGEFGV